MGEILIVGFAPDHRSSAQAAMQVKEDQDYSFGRFCLDTRERILLYDGEGVPITLKAFDILFVLVQNSGHIVEKDTLMKQVWPNTFVEEANLTQHIYKLRKTLGVRADGRQYIETVPRRGYRFTAAASKSNREGDSLAVQQRAETIASTPNGQANSDVEPVIISLSIVRSGCVGVGTDDDDLSNRITESLANILSGLPQLRIMSRNIIFALQK